MADVQLEKMSEEEKREKILELGRHLKELREAQGITLERASESTKIQKKYIAAIEEGELASLPKGPYCRSFLRQYCALLDAPDIWTKYDTLTNSAPAVRDELKPRLPHDDAAGVSVAPKVFRSSPRLWIFLLVVASLAAAVWVTLRYRGEILLSSTSPMGGGTAPIVRELEVERAENAQATESPQAQEQAPESDASASVDLGWMDGNPPANQSTSVQSGAPDAAVAAADTTTPDAALEPEPQKEALLVLTVRSRSWLRISRGERMLYEGTMLPGDRREYRVEGSTPLRVRCGRPSATDAAWFGAPAKALGGGSDPVTLYYWSDGAVTTTETR